MDACRETALFGPVLQVFEPVVGSVWTFEVRGEAWHELTGRDGLGREPQLFVQRFVRAFVTRDSTTRAISAEP